MLITEDAPIEVTVHRSPRDGKLVVQISTNSAPARWEETGSFRVNINDGLIWEGDVEKGNEVKPVVLMQDGETFENDDVEVIDITDLFGHSRGGSSGYTEEDVRSIAARLRNAGFASAADSIVEEWGL